MTSVTGTSVTGYALTRRPCSRLDEGALTYMSRATLDLALAELQHQFYREALASAGPKLIDLPAADAFPDSTFVEDAVLAFPECFVLCRPGTASRVDEPELISPFLPQDRPVFHIEAPATLDGGDVLQIGHDIYVGLSTRTNAAAATALGRLLSRCGYRIVLVSVTGALHLKTAVTAPTDDFLLANPDWVDLSPFGARQIIPVDQQEPFSANTLRVGERLFMQSSHPRTIKRLQTLGLEVGVLNISEFAKIEAGLTCMSVVVPPVSLCSPFEGTAGMSDHAR
jgi:dimethylargininase